MSCGQIALRELCVPIERYYASEIDKHAIAQTQLNFPDTIQLGDVEQWRTWDIDWESVDLLLAGSPCQGFSLAGKMLGHGDPRSRLYWVFLEILRHVQAVNPSVKYLLENNTSAPADAQRRGDRHKTPQASAKQAAGGAGRDQQGRRPTHPSKHWGAPPRGDVQGELQAAPSAGLDGLQLVPSCLLHRGRSGHDEPSSPRSTAPRREASLHEACSRSRTRR